MGYKILKRIFFITCLSFFLSYSIFTTRINTAKADELLPENVGVIDQLLQSQDMPEGLFIYTEDSLGKIKKIPATSKLLAKSKNINTYIVGGNLPFTKDQQILFTIFSKDKLLGQQAAPVKHWTSDQLLANTPKENELKKIINDSKKEISLLISERQKIEKKLQPIQEEASKAGKVDEIIELELELTSIKKNIVDKEILIQELDFLSKKKDLSKSPKSLSKTNSVLSSHLKEAAKITSVADRLERRKRQIATKAFKRKLRAIKEMEYTNIEHLAQEVIRYRKIRKNLEQEMNLLPPTDEF